MIRFLFILIVGILHVSVSAQNKAVPQTDEALLKYNPMIFGHFVEHFHTQVYGGIFDPQSRFADEDGFRTDVIEAMKRIKVPIVRWPGGCFISSYHWLDGVGENRTPSFDKAWQVEDPNTFGTDEFVKWCRKIGCEPFICTNAGTGTEEEMSDWVEYCNLSVGKWGRMRIENGYEEPHDVKYWSVGNENWGGHEIGAKPADVWGPLVRESAKMMRAVNHDLKLFAAATPWESWTLPLLEYAGYHLDYVSIHEYWDPLQNQNDPAPYINCMMKTDGPQETIDKTVRILEKAGYGDGKVKIAFDEWNLRSWHHPDLHNAGIVDIACFSPIVNTRGPLFVHEDGIVRRTTYHVFDMYVNMLEDHVYPLKVKSEKLKHGRQSTSMIDCVLTSDKERTKYVYAIVNKSPDETISLSLGLDKLGITAPESVKAKALMGNSPDDYNEIGAENRAVPVDMTMKISDGEIELPPHSLVMLAF